MSIKKLTKLDLFIITILVFLIASSVWLIVSDVDERSATLEGPPYRASLTNEESIEIIYTHLQAFDFELIEGIERYQVVVAPGGDPEYAMFDYYAEIILVNAASEMEIAFLTTIRSVGSESGQIGLINDRRWIGYRIERAFQESHGINVDKIFFTFARAAWSEEEKEEHMEVIIQDLENQIQDFIDQLRNE